MNIFKRLKGPLKKIHYSSFFQFHLIDYIKGLEFDFIALSILIKVLHLILK